MNTCYYCYWIWERHKKIKKKKGYEKSEKEIKRFCEKEYCLIKELSMYGIVYHKKEIWKERKKNKKCKILLLSISFVSYGT